MDAGVGVLCRLTMVKASAEVKVCGCVAVWLLLGCVIHTRFEVFVCVYVHVCLNQPRVYLYLTLLLHNMCLTVSFCMLSYLVLLAFF